MKFVWIVLFTLCWSCAGEAQEYDLSTMTCDALTKADKNDVRLIVAWLSGYYTNENDDEHINLSSLDSAQQKLLQFCGRETSFPVKNAAEGILSR